MTAPAESLSADPIGSLVEAYEAARDERGPVALADFLPPRGDPLYVPALTELVRVEIEYAWSAGEPKALEDYRGDFPELFEDRERLRGVAFEEYRQRRLAGQHVAPAEYRDAYDIDITGWPEAPPTSAHTQAVGASRSASELRSERAAEFPRVGSELAGFRLLAELGRGAFGRVYLARQGDLAGRPVALKVSRDAYGESQTLARLQHTNIMPVYSVHRAGPFHAVCMPYFPSLTLAEVIGEAPSGDTALALLETVREQSRRGVANLPETRNEAAPAAALWAPLRGRGRTDAVVWIGAKLADGLAHAHARGVIHRDLKPANVLLTDEGQPLILDFNLAEDAHRPAGERAFLGGTLPYMAPEILRACLERRRHADPRGDIYALGVILFELLAGRRPFPDRGGPWEEAIRKMIADRAGSPPAPHAHDGAVTPALGAIIRKCLQPEPARRYSAASQLAEDLRAQFEHRPLMHQPEPSTRERVAKFLRRHPGLFSATRVGVAAAVLVGVLAATAYGWRERLLTLEAHDAFVRFREEARPALLGGPSLTLATEDGAAGAQQLTALLAKQGALDNPVWFETGTFRRLNTRDRHQSRELVGELLHRLAINFAHQAAHNLPRRAPLLEQALEFNRRAEAAYPPEAVPRAVRQARALIYELRVETPLRQFGVWSALTGRPAEVRAALDYARRATEARTQARETPLQTQRDRVLAAAILMSPVGRRDEAPILALLAEAERLPGADANFWAVTGLLYRDLGRRDQALVCFNTSLSLDEDQWWTWAARGEVRIESDPAGALADLDHALSLSGGDPHVRRNRALARERAGDYVGAEADLTELLRADPQRVEWLQQRARVRRLKGDAAGEKSDLAALRASEPHSADGWVARAYVQPDAVAAGADLDAALALDPDHAQALQHKANVLAERLNRPREAVAVLSRAVAAHPEAVEAWAGRAVLQARLGDRAAAHADAHETLKRNPQPIFVYQAANAFALTSKTVPGDRAQALRLLAQALQAEPKLAELADSDPDFAPLRQDANFRTLIDAARLMVR